MSAKTIDLMAVLVDSLKRSEPGRPTHTLPMGVLAAEPLEYQQDQHARHYQPVAIEARFQQILAESRASEARVVAEGGLLTTDDSLTVARVVDQLEDNPFAFATSYLNLTRFVKSLHGELTELRDRVSGLAGREVV